MKVLDGFSPETVYNSLCNILNINKSEIDKYIKENLYRIKREDNFWEYNNIDINELFSSIYSTNINDEELLSLIKFDVVTVFHLTTAIDKENILKQGLLNLKSLFVKDNSIKTYLKKFGIELKRENDKYLVLYNDKEIDYTKNALFKRRLDWDACVNGFLFRDNIEKNSNVEHLNMCPEFIQNICQCINKKSIIKEWERKSKPTIVKFFVNVDDIHLSTYGFEIQLEIEKYKFYITKAIEFLLFKKTGYWDDDNNTMIYLNEGIDVLPEQIMELIEV